MEVEEFPHMAGFGDVHGPGEAGDVPPVAAPVGDEPMVEALLDAGEFRVVVVDAVVDVEAEFYAQVVEPGDFLGGVGPEFLVPVPAVPVAGGFEIGVDDEDAEGYPVAAQGAEDAAIVLLGERGVVGVPVTEGPFGQHGAGPGEGSQVAEALLVVEPIPEEISVLVGVAAG